MALFRNTTDLKQFADIHKQTDWDTLRPYVEQAETDYLMPLLGKDLMKSFDVVVNYAGNESKMLSQMFTAEKNKELFSLIARSLANFALYEAFPFLNTSVGDIGVQQQQSQGGISTPAAQWRYESRRVAHLSVGDSYIEKTLEFLENNATDFPLWADSEHFTINKEYLIGDSSMLSKYLGTNDSRRTYIALRPYIRVAEKDLIAILGMPLFEELKTQISGHPSTLTNANKLLLEVAREALAWTAYYYALPFISIRIGGEGVQVVSKNDSINSRSAATKDDKESARAQAGQFSDKFLNTLRQYMDVNIDAYPLYKTYMGDRYPVETYRRKVNRRGSGHFAI